MTGSAWTQATFTGARTCSNSAASILARAWTDDLRRLRRHHHRARPARHDRPDLRRPGGVRARSTAALDENRLTLHEVLRREFEPVRAPLRRGRRLGARARRRSGRDSTSSSALARERDWRLVVLSSGFRELIQPVLEREGLGERRAARRTRSSRTRRAGAPASATRSPAPSAGSRASAPRWSPSRTASERVYVGDGISDRCGARGLRSRLRAARPGRATCAERGVPFEPFDDFHEIVATLTKLGRMKIRRATEATRPCCARSGRSSSSRFPSCRTAGRSRGRSGRGDDPRDGSHGPRAARRGRRGRRSGTRWRSSKTAPSRAAHCLVDSLRAARAAPASGLAKALMAEVAAWGVRARRRDDDARGADVERRGAGSIYDRLGFVEESRNLVQRRWRSWSERLTADRAGAVASARSTCRRTTSTAVVRAVQRFVPRLPGGSRGSVVLPPERLDGGLRRALRPGARHAAAPRARAVRPDGRRRAA